MQPTCTAIHDLSCYAKSSLTVVMPVLEAMGIEVSVLPTAILSSQTDGFDSYYFKDTTEELTHILSVWESLSLHFDALYSGFLGSAAQAALLTSFFRRQRAISKTLILVDPVLGDNGSLYGPFSEKEVVAMRSLVREADVITPNTTEAALLLDRPYRQVFDEKTALGWARELSLEAGASVAITSVLLDDSSAVVCHAGGSGFLVPYEAYSASYPGCGDLFASLLLGFLINKESFQTSVAQAVTYTSRAISRTLEAGYEKKHGIAPGLILADLLALERQC